MSLHRSANYVVRINLGAGAPRQRPADIWLVQFDPGPLSVAIQRGENAHRIVSHYNLVRRVTRVGSWNGAAIWLERPHCSPQCAVLVQEGDGGRVIAAAMTRRERR